jgi:hypothetical protein
MDYVWNTNLKISNGLIKSRKSKDRQYKVKGDNDLHYTVS